MCSYDAPSQMGELSLQEGVGLAKVTQQISGEWDNGRTLAPEPQLSPPHLDSPKSQGFTCKTVGLVAGEAEEVRGLATADKETQASLCTSDLSSALGSGHCSLSPSGPVFPRLHGKQRVNVHSPTLAFCRVSSDKAHPVGPWAGVGKR